MSGLLAILVAPAVAAASDLPTNLQVTALTSDAVTIAFTPSTRANRTGHRAVLDKNPPDGTAASKDLGRDATSVSFTGLTANTAYRVSVLVVVPPDNGIGNWVSFTTPAAPSASVAAAPNPVAEGSPVTVTATLSKALGSDVTIPIALTAGTAEAGDHGTLTGITIAAGSTSNTGTITTDADADTDDETFTVALGDLPSSVTAGSAVSVTVTITDPHVASLSLTAAPNPVAESSSVTVTATLSKALENDLVIPLTLTAGTAETGDYGSLAGIAIAAGSTSNTGTITTANDADTDDETFTVALGNLPSSIAARGAASVTVTIIDPRAVTLSAAPNPVREGSSVTVTAALSSALGFDVTVPIDVTAASTDTAERSDHGSLTGIAVAAGSTSNTGTVTTATDADNDDETFTIELARYRGEGWLTRSGGTGSVVVTIVDPPLASLSAAPNPVNEGTSVTVTAILSKALGSEVSIPIGLTAGTADTSDYGSLASIAIPAGATSAAGAVTTEDDADTDDETFTVAFGDLPSSVAAGSTTSVVVTITDPDVPSVGLSASPNPVLEGSSVTVTATISKALGSDVTIPLTLTAGTAEPGDHGSLSSITIAAGSTSNTGTITTATDADTDDETFTVALGALPSSVTERGTTSQTVTIVDPRPVNLSARNAVEGSPVIVTAAIPKALGSDVTIPVSLTAGTAKPGDYGSLSSITIAAGSTSGAGTIATAADHDNDDETFTVSLDPGNLPPLLTAGSRTSATATIIDPPFVTFSATPNPVDEGLPVNLVATLSKPNSAPTRFTLYLIRPPQNSHRTVFTAFVIPAGKTSGSLSVPTLMRDADSNEYQFTAVAGSVQGGKQTTVVLSCPCEVTVTVIDRYNEGGGGGDGGGGGGGGGGGAPPPDDADRDGGGAPPPDDGGGAPPRAAVSADAECTDGRCRARTGVPVRFDDGSSGTVRSRRWEFGDGATSTSATPSHSWSSPGFYTVTLTASDGETESTARRTFLVEAAEPAGTCEPSAATRCLQDSRFAVELERRTAEGETAAGHVVREGTNDSALFHFFGSDNWEVLVKVLDGCAANGRVWVYGASATTAGYTIRVTDTVTGRVREYRNEPGEAARAITDVNAFPGVCGA